MNRTNSATKYRENQSNIIKVIVSSRNIGFVTKGNEEKIDLNISREVYDWLSNNAFKYSAIHTSQNYVRAINDGYYEGRISKK